MGFLDTLFGGGAEREAAERSRAALGDYSRIGTAALDKGYATSLGELGKAGDIYGDLRTKYGRASDLRLDALGANGPEGNARATAAFEAGPGYQFTLDQGLDAIARRRALAGMSASGNADIDAIKFGTGLADQTYGDWLTRLGEYVNPEMTAAGGAAGVHGSLSDLGQIDAQNRIGLQGNVTSGLIGSYNTEAAGKAAGAKNLLNAGLSIGRLGVDYATGGLGSAFGKKAA